MIFLPINFFLETKFAREDEGENKVSHRFSRVFSLVFFTLFGFASSHAPQRLEYGVGVDVLGPVDGLLVPP